MKPSLLQLTLMMASCAVVSTPACAQGAAPAPVPARSVAGGAARPQTAAAPARAADRAADRGANRAAVGRVTAAGSVMVLADGIVVHADVADIRPPAPGFVYER